MNSGEKEVVVDVEYGLLNLLVLWFRVIRGSASSRRRGTVVTVVQGQLNSYYGSESTEF